MSTTRFEANQAPVRVVEEEIVVTTKAPSSEATSRSFAQRIGEAARDKPASAALITMGVAWLFTGGAKVSLFSGNRRERHLRDYRIAVLDPDYAPARYRHEALASSVHASGDTLQRAGTAAADQVNQAGAEISDASSAAASAVGDRASALGHGVSAAASGASEAASHAYGGLEAATHAAYRTSRKAAVGARREAEHLQQTLGSFLESQLLAVGLLGLAVGAGIAATLPKTQTEQELLGESSNAVKGQAYQLVSEQMASARRVADLALEEAAREARAQGLSEDTIADVVRTFGEKLTDVTATATDSLNREIGKVGSTKKA